MPDDDAPSEPFKKIPDTAGGEVPAGDDTAGEREASALGAGTLEEQTLALTRSLRRHINLAVLLLVWLSAILIGAALAVAAFHHLTAWGWLTEIQLAVLDTFLFSGALVSTVGRYIVNRIF